MKKSKKLSIKKVTLRDLDQDTFTGIAGGVLTLPATECQIDTCNNHPKSCQCFPTVVPTECNVC